MNYLEKFNKMVKDLSVDEVTLVDGNHWYGDYGCIWDEYNGFHGNPHKLAKTFYKFIEKHWKRALPSKYWKKENRITAKGTTISLILSLVSFFKFPPLKYLETVVVPTPAIFAISTIVSFFIDYLLNHNFNYKRLKKINKELY